MSPTIDDIVLLLAAGGYGELSDAERIAMDKSIRDGVHFIYYQRSFLQTLPVEKSPREVVKVTVTFSRTNKGKYAPYKCSLVLARQFPGAAPDFQTAIAQLRIPGAQIPDFAMLYRHTSLQFTPARRRDRSLPAAAHSKMHP